MAGERLDKILANVGIGSRKEVKKLIKQGLVEVEGIVASDPGMSVDPARQTLIVAGEEIRYRKHVWIMMNKPAGVLSATEDSRQRTAVDLLDEALQSCAPAPAGRLDKDTEGFLLLTNDGALIHRIITPKKHVPKTYLATIDGVVTEEDRAAFSKGVRLDDGYVTMPAELNILTSGKRSEIELTIYEGKFHQVKRMFQAVGKEVVYLKRLSIGGLRLDPSLAPGAYRELTEEELEQIFSAK